MLCAWAGQALAANRPVAVADEAKFPMFVQVHAPVGNAEPAGLHDAIAAAILAVVWSDLGTSANGTLALAKLEMERIDEHGWQVRGEGTVALPKAQGERIGLSFRTRYDGRLQTIDRPRIEFGGVAPGERMVPNDATVIRQLEDELSRRIAEDFGERNTRMQFDTISSVMAGQHLLRVTAEGLADFGMSGTSKANIEGLYDLRKGHWRKLDYQLSAGRDWQPVQSGTRHFAGL